MPTWILYLGFSGHNFRRPPRPSLPFTRGEPMYDAYDALLKLPLWGIVVAVAIPASVILFLSARFALSRERANRTNDNVYTAAARLAGVCLAILGAFCVL